jgi:alpha-1,6-mannosyltransferase
MAAFLVLTLWAWTARRRLATGALLAASVLIKPLTLMALPAFWRPWDWHVPAAFVATAVLVYLPYLGVGGEVVGFLPAYVGEEGMDSGAGFYLLGLVGRPAGPLSAATSMVYLLAGTALLAALALAAGRDHRSDAATTAGHAQRLLLVGLFVLSPVVLPRAGATRLPAAVVGRRSSLPFSASCCTPHHRSTGIPAPSSCRL